MVGLCGWHNRVGQGGLSDLSGCLRASKNLFRCNVGPTTESKDTNTIMRSDVLSMTCYKDKRCLFHIVAFFRMYSDSSARDIP